MKVGFIQTSPIFGNVKANVESVVENIISMDADLIVLPELFSTGYQFKSRKEVSKLAEELPKGYAAKMLIDTAKKKNLFIVFGIAEKCGKRFYNSSVNKEEIKVIDINPKLARNKKINPKNDLFKDRRIDIKNLVIS